MEKQYAIVLLVPLISLHISPSPTPGPGTFHFDVWLNNIPQFIYLREFFPTYAPAGTTIEYILSL